MLIEVVAPPPLDADASAERIAAAKRGPYRALPPGLSCVPCGRTATRSYALRDWNASYAIIVTVWQTWTVHVPTCDRCQRRRAFARPLFVLALMLVALAFPMLWDVRVYVTSVDQTLMTAGMFGFLGAYLAALVHPRADRWLMPVAIERFDSATGRATLWVRDEHVAERMRTAAEALTGAGD